MERNKGGWSPKEGARHVAIAASMFICMRVKGPVFLHIDRAGQGRPFYFWGPKAGTLRSFTFAFGVWMVCAWMVVSKFVRGEVGFLPGQMFDQT